MRNRLLPKIVVSAWSLALITMGGLGQFFAPDVAQAAEIAADCASCHEQSVASFKSSFHGKAWKGTNGCQACHGQTNQHLDTEQSKKTIFSYAKDGGRSAKERAAQCMSCHSSSSHVAFWETSKHKSAGMSCDSCHTGHSNLPKNLKKPQTELCFSCHKDIRSESNRQSHHPIKEGKVSCSDCHDPHGGFGSKMIKADSINELCFNCHADKRGPYMFEHPPVEENCMNCHTAHGSNHTKLLTRKGPNLCQSCHDWTQHPGGAYTASGTFDKASPAKQLVARNCLNCHNNVHGSNAPGVRGMRFVR